MAKEDTKIDMLRKIPFVGKRIANCLEDVPTVGVLRLTGIIGPPGSPGRRVSLALSELSSSIDRLFKLPRIKGVALIVNSPGGSPVQSAMIADRIRQLSVEKEIPVYAFCEDVAASGGYWLACSAEEIFADPASIVGSIGVISAGFGFSEMLAKIGVERRVHTSGKKKAMLDPFAAEVRDDVERLQEIQEDIHDQFKEYVRSRRGDRLLASEEILFSGEFWTGRRAHELGLIDGLGDMRSIMRQKFGEKVNLQLVDIKRRFSFKSIIGGANSTEYLIDVLENHLHWRRYGL